MNKAKRLKRELVSALKSSRIKIIPKFEFKIGQSVMVEGLSGAKFKMTVTGTQFEHIPMMGCPDRIVLDFINEASDTDRTN
jgi:hypothetical protein